MVKLIRLFKAFGFDPRVFILSFGSAPFVIFEYIKIWRQNRSSKEPWRVRFSYPCFVDRYFSNGDIKGHYFQQDLFVANKIFRSNPSKHVDVGSSIYGFVSHVAAFRSIEVLDIRNIEANFHNIIFKKCDITSKVLLQENYCDSLSCLHALEHFGLGRYGDPIEIDGYKTALANMQRMVVKGGVIYISVPIGRQRIMFNAHRVFSVQLIIDELSACAQLMSFSYIDDGGGFHSVIELDESLVDLCNNMDYGCGIFEFEKK